MFSDVRPSSHRSLLVSGSGAVLGAGDAWVAGALPPGSLTGVLAPDRVAGAGPVRTEEIRKVATIATPMPAASGHFLRQRTRPSGFVRSPETGRAEDNQPEDDQEHFDQHVVPDAPPGGDIGDGAGGHVAGR